MGAVACPPPARENPCACHRRNSSTRLPVIESGSRRWGTAGRFAEASSWCISNHGVAVLLTDGREEACHYRSCLPDTSQRTRFCLAKHHRGALCRASQSHETDGPSLLFHHLATTIISASIVPPRRLPAPWSRC